MTENDFNKEADTVFARIEHGLDDTDIDYDSNGTVMELEFTDGGKVIITRHVPNREIWLAARSGGFHYQYRDGKWLSQRDGSELFAKLGELVAQGSGSAIRF